MKKYFIYILFICLMLSGCNFSNAKENSTNDKTPDSSASAATTKENHTAKIKNETLPLEVILSSDGVLESMSMEKLIEKLSYLDETSTMTDIINIFGKPPKMDVYSNLGIWEYYSGDINISIYISDPYETSLYAVNVHYKDYSISLDLEKSFLAQ